MGYNTNYDGEITITNIDLEKVRHLRKYLGNDKRDLQKLHPSLVPVLSLDTLPFNHFDLELTENLSALIWNGSEKSYGIDDMLIFLKAECGLTYEEGDFFVCQGEEPGDRYKIIIKDGDPVNISMTLSEGITTCPECGHHYDINDPV